MFLPEFWSLEAPQSSWEGCHPRGGTSSTIKTLQANCSSLGGQTWQTAEQRQPALQRLGTEDAERELTHAELRDATAKSLLMFPVRLRALRHSCTMLRLSHKAHPGKHGVLRVRPSSRKP